LAASYSRRSLRFVSSSRDRSGCAAFAESIVSVLLGVQRARQAGESIATVSAGDPAHSFSPIVTRLRAHPGE
jgi:hypothetical protein